MSHNRFHRSGQYASSNLPFSDNFPHRNNRTTKGRSQSGRPISSLTSSYNSYTPIRQPGVSWSTTPPSIPDLPPPSASAASTSVDHRRRVSDAAYVHHSSNSYGEPLDRFQQHLPQDNFGTSTIDSLMAGRGNRSVTGRTRSGGAGVNIIFESTAVMTLIVVASLALIVGLIYLLIYFKSIKPMSARSRSYMQQAGAGSGSGGGGKAADDDGGRTRSTHPFFRRS